MNTRPISISHLVVGLIFLGLAGGWLVQRTTEISFPGPEIALPLLLIAAGALGLIASLASARNTASRRSAPAPVEPGDAPADTIEHHDAEEDR